MFKTCCVSLARHPSGPLRLRKKRLSKYFTNQATPPKETKNDEGLKQMLIYDPRAVCVDKSGLVVTQRLVRIDLRNTKVIPAFQKYMTVVEGRSNDEFNPGRCVFMQCEGDSKIVTPEELVAARKRREEEFARNQDVKKNMLYTGPRYHIVNYRAKVSKIDKDGVCRVEYESFTLLERINTKQFHTSTFAFKEPECIDLGKLRAEEQKKTEVISLDDEPAKKKDVAITGEEKKGICEVKVSLPMGLWEDDNELNVIPLPTPYDERVVIIGAGVAGISAAHCLITSGITNCTILEACNRPGGRVRSYWLKDVAVELGADWTTLHFWDNHVTDCAVRGGLMLRPISKSDPCKGLFNESDGRLLILSISLRAYFRQVEIIKSAAAVLGLSGCRQRGSVVEFMGVRLQQELRRFKKKMRLTAGRVMIGVVNALRKKYGDDISLVTNDSLGTFAYVPGGELKIPLGFAGALNPLLEEIGSDRIKYSKEVQTVRWGTVPSDTVPKAVVRCSDGTEYPADYVIITCSLGVMKDVAESMFCPDLPANKIDAIHRLDYGHCNKIFLEFDRPLWVWRDGHIKMTWNEGELASKDGWLKGLVKLEELDGSEYVVAATVAGPNARDMERCSDEEIIDVMCEFIKETTGDFCVPKPARIYRTRWSRNKFFRGAYSITDDSSANATIELQNDLSSPLPPTSDNLPPIILFAGEASCVGLNSTVHGARLSGMREAERLVRVIKDRPWEDEDDLNVKKATALQVC